MSMTSRFVVQSTLALLVVGFVALLTIVGTTIWLGERAQVYFNDVIAARDTRAAAVELRNAVQTAEASQRGFLLTGSEIYLAPYEPAKSLAQKQLAILQRGLTGEADTQVVLERLTSLVADKFSELDQTIALKRDRRDADALAIVRTNRGKAVMDEANVFFSGVIRSADDRLTRGVGEQRANAATLRSVSVIAAVVIVLVVGGAIVTVRRYTRELAEARDEVTLLNTGLEKRVEQRTADLTQVNEEIQRFAYIVTHDLRAPLVNIMGFTSELERSVETLQKLIDQSNAANDSADPVARSARLAATEDLPEAIGFIRSSTKKMDNLINAILKLSREGRRELRPEQINLADTIRTSAAAIQHQLSEANGQINVHIDVPPVWADRLSLEQVFGNLLDNAVKYRSARRTLQIDVRARVLPGERVGVEIADNGRGIAEEDRERVFELFRRAGAQNEPGEGIGLAHVRTVVRNLGVEITLTSAPDVGTTFRLILPLYPPFSQRSDA